MSDRRSERGAHRRDRIGERRKGRRRRKDACVIAEFRFNEAVTAEDLPFHTDSKDSRSDDLRLTPKNLFRAWPAPPMLCLHMRNGTALLLTGLMLALVVAVAIQLVRS